jgi:hypothetical protein
MKNKYILTLGMLSSVFIGKSFAQSNIKYQVLNQSVVSIQQSGTSSFGTFRTMESLQYSEGENNRAIQIKIEQPLCDQQLGVLAMINPSGAEWRYKILRKEGDLISEGKVGYDRRIGSLKAGNYLINFTLPDGTSTIDEFVVRSPKGVQVEIALDKTNQYTTGKDIKINASSDFATEYVWNFGDGSKMEIGAESTTHSYAKPGIYTLTVEATNFDCSSTLVKQIEITGPTASTRSEY